MSKIIGINRRDTSKKIRVNITVDKAMLEKAKTKLNMFGGKLSTLFNAYLNDFVNSMENSNKELIRRIEELEEKVKKFEKKI